MTSILPHGGTLIRRIADGEEREKLLKQASSHQSIALNTWTLSDLDLIGVGAFSPLTRIPERRGLSLGSKQYAAG